MVTASGQPPGELADGAPGLEAPPVARPYESGHGQVVATLLVLAGLEAPGVAVLLVHALEVTDIHVTHGNTTSQDRRKRARTWGGTTGDAAVASGRAAIDAR